MTIATSSPRVSTVQNDFQSRPDPTIRLRLTLQQIEQTGQITSANQVALFSVMACDRSLEAQLQQQIRHLLNRLNRGEIQLID